MVGRPLLFISDEASSIQAKQVSSENVLLFFAVILLHPRKSKHIGLDATVDRPQRPLRRPQNGKCPRLIGRKLRYNKSVPSLQPHIVQEQTLVAFTLLPPANHPLRGEELSSKQKVTGPGRQKQDKRKEVEGRLLRGIEESRPILTPGAARD